MTIPERMEARKAEETLSAENMTATKIAWSPSCEEDEAPTNWKAVVIAGIVAFLAGLENTVVGISEWPYMQKIDPEATSQFFGIATALSKTGHALATVLFAFWSYRIQSIRLPLIAGRIVAFVACTIYLFVEFLPEGRRYLMLCCYFLFGVAASSASVLRTYIALVSSHKDRARAYSATALANMLAIVIGPICQLAFSSIEYPGMEIIPGKLRFHIFSAPVWVASATNFVSVAIIMICLKEVPREEKLKEKEEDGFSVKKTLEKLKNLKTLSLPWILIGVCWLERLAANLATTTLQAMASPLMMSSFGWDGAKTVRVMAVAMLIVGLLSILIASAFAFFKLNKWLSARTSFLIAMLISIALYVLSYPYTFTSAKMPAFNATTGAGCNPAEYSWCDTAYATWPVLFMPICVTVLGIGLPLAAISIDTIYSKVLGNIDQSLMQGLIVVIEDIVLIVGPIYSSALFTHSGQSILWLVNGIITTGAVILWLGFFRQFGKYR